LKIFLKSANASAPLGFGALFSASPIKKSSSFNSKVFRYIPNFSEGSIIIIGPSLSFLRAL